MLRFETIVKTSVLGFEPTTLEINSTQTLITKDNDHQHYTPINMRTTDLF